MLPLKVALNMASVAIFAAAAASSVGCTNAPSRFACLFRSSTFASMSGAPPVPMPAPPPVEEPPVPMPAPPPVEEPPVPLPPLDAPPAFELEPPFPIMLPPPLLVDEPPLFIDEPPLLIDEPPVSSPAPAPPPAPQPPAAPPPSSDPQAATVRQRHDSSARFISDTSIRSSIRGRFRP